LGDVIVIFINQIRDEIGGQGGPRTSTSGGRSVKHYMHHRIELRKEVVLEERDQWNEAKMKTETSRVRVGHFARIQLRKNKIGKPEREMKLYFSYDLGIFDPVEDVKQFLAQHGMLKLSSPESSYWIVEGHDKKIQGKKRLDDFIRNNPEHIEALVASARERERVA
jgi:hypothetical protein